MKRRLLLPILLAAASLAVVAQTSAMSAPKLIGTVGPGFTIKLVDGTGKKVTSLKAGKYTFVISDKASIHNFVLEGPGVERTITAVPFVGTKTVTVRLRPGTYEYYCRPHEAAGMKGKFKVTA